MKNRYFKYIKTVSTMLILVAMLSACVNSDEFFELPDRGGIGTQIWDTEGAIQLHLNRAYDVIIPDFGYSQLGSTQLHARSGIHYASDESFIANEDEYALAALGLGGEPLNNNSVFYAGDKYSGNKGENKYFDIARCNNAIQGINEGSLPQAIKNTYLGQYYALRAMVYFGLVKVYGGVPLVLTPQSPDNITVSGRSSAAVCIKAIVNDLDSAMSKLNGITWSDATGRGKIDKSAAAALKAKVLLYWASPQFNPTNDGKHIYDPNRWVEALKANKEAYDICLAAGHKLVDNYADIFRKEGTDNPEAIILRTYSASIPQRGQDVERTSRPSSESGQAAERYRAASNLLEAYTMKDGNVTSNPQKYSYDPVIFWNNRDPRFDATIAYNGASWPLSGKPNRKEWSYVGALGGDGNKGLYCKKYTTAGLATGSVSYNKDIGGGNGMDWIEMRFAEVILNYAECANETGNISLAKEMVRKIRVRAGIEQGNTGNDYGLGAANTILDMRELIFNERFVEFAFENKRNSDLRRLRRMSSLSGPLETIVFEPKNGTAKTQLETADANGVLLRDKLNLNDKNTYLQYFSPPYYNSPINRTFNVPAYHIFYTFNLDFQYSGENIQPTVGWAGGTFDPLD